MGRWVSTNEKRFFLKWFIKTHRLKRVDSRYLLDYLIKNSHILDHVQFTEKNMKSEKMIVISSTQSDEPGFEYYNNHRKTTDVSRAVSDLMEHPTDKVYLLVHFYGKMLNHRYLNLIENPALENTRRYKKYEEYAKDATKILSHSLDENKLQRLRKQIDQALDRKDKKLFNKLVEELKQYEQTEQNA
ncbi:YpiB family protein [Desertibacillus haloalkaliphilus]|uniref:YpiB family protein n=1 Tax=Desertibacillus haloalkaliphilus TaxID=1328930 RepID=UPI001C269DF2|nr:YpiB family protein [Desertibacillus haloalkaliphilus]MBU8907972.1 YpiB family protein [Desertibacillus haloalkaliphilus]